ncbi:MAG: hypothetical protein MZV64_31690 [Ignavibacteriales bacterium]|nr:hypothetical protein [Ignavibacteriales bacterium]
MSTIEAWIAGPVARHRAENSAQPRALSQPGKNPLHACVRDQGVGHPEQGPDRGPEERARRKEGERGAGRTGGCRGVCAVSR